jgi:hypothetical protein
MGFVVGIVRNFRGLCRRSNVRHSSSIEEILSLPHENVPFFFNFLSASGSLCNSGGQSKETRTDLVIVILLMVKIDIEFPGDTSVSKSNWSLL